MRYRICHSLKSILNSGYALVNNWNPVFYVLENRIHAKVGI
jgi:hypothetical protein